MNYSDRFLRETASYSVLDIMLADIAVRIQLTPTDYQKAVDHYEAINEWIDREDSVLHGRVQLFYPQGGFMISATTARHDTEADFDIDVMAQIDWPTSVDPERALSTLDRAIRGEPGSRYYKRTERKTRCSTVHYDEMHLDVTPAVRLITGEEKTSFIFHSKPSDPSEPKQTLTPIHSASGSGSTVSRAPMKFSVSISRNRPWTMTVCGSRCWPSRTPIPCRPKCRSTASPAPSSAFN